MSDKENNTLPVALLITGIVCIMIASCVFVWCVVRCERWRRRRKYRPKCGNRYSMNASHMAANGQELKDLQPRQLKPSVNLIHYTSKNSVNSQSIPSLLSMDDSVASEPLYSGRNYEEGEDVRDYVPTQDLSIARILGSFPELPYYQPHSSVSSSTENVRDTKVPLRNLPRPKVPSAAATSKSKDCSINSSLYTDYAGKASEGSVNTAHLTAPKSSNVGSTNTVSSAESLKVEIPGGAIRIRYMTDNFQFTRLRAKKDKAVSTPNIASAHAEGEPEKVDQKKSSVFETEV